MNILNFIDTCLNGINDETVDITNDIIDVMSDCFDILDENNYGFDTDKTKCLTLISVPRPDDLNGVGFSVVWSILDTKVNAAKNSPDNQEILRMSDDCEYLLSDVSYQGIENWEIELFKEVEPKLIIYRKKFKHLSKMKKMLNTYNFK